MSLNSIVANYPRFAPVLNPGAQSIAYTLAQLATPEVLQPAIARSMSNYELPEKFAAQVWWFSLCNTLVAPTTFDMVCGQQCHNLDLAAGSLFLRDAADPYWFGFRPGEFPPELDEAELVEQFAYSVEKIHACLTPVIEQIGVLTGVKPAPLRAILNDALMQAATDAANEWEDLEVLAEIAACIPAKFRFAAIRDDAWVDIAEPAVDSFEDEDFAVVRRNSCCMIYRSPKADMCVSCPKHDAEFRQAAYIRHAQQRYF